MELAIPEGQKPAIAADLLADARDSWGQQSKERVRVSPMQIDIERVLRQMGEQPVLKHLTDDGLFAVDVAFPGTASGCCSLSVLIPVPLKTGPVPLKSG